MKEPPERPHRVLLGISGGIAAYKAVELARLLATRGHQVRCALTRAAEAFVTPLTLEVISGRPVYREEYLSAAGSGEELHITAAGWADALCVAPATAHTLARLALGLADDFLTTTALAFDGPLVLAPAMHSIMWEKEAVRTHLDALARRGAAIVGPVTGPLASGETGPGRMAEPAEIAAAVESVLRAGGRAPGPAAAGAGERLAGRTVLVSAGPTREPLDPVRFLSSRSTGRMGFALAEAAAAAGARTLLVSGPVELPTPAGVERRDVVTAEEMREAVYRLAPEADLVVMAAAVADFRPRAASAEKIKKRSGLRTLELELNPDILAGLAAVAPRALRVGFAAETGALEAEALRKLEEKAIDLVVVNDVSRSDVGFASADNEVTVFGRRGERRSYGKQPKRELAARLVELFAEALERLERQPAAADR